MCSAQPQTSCQFKQDTKLDYIYFGSRHGFVVHVTSAVLRLGGLCDEGNDRFVKRRKRCLATAFFAVLLLLLLLALTVSLMEWLGVSGRRSLALP